MKPKLRNTILISLIISFALSLLFYTGLFSNIQAKLSDNLYGGLFPREDILIIAIDDKSLQEVGRWPWNREVFAKIIKLLNETKVTAIDVAFFEKSDTYNDNELIASLSLSKNVILPVEYTKYTKEDNEIVGKDILLPIEGLKEEALSLGYINIITDADGVTRAVNLDITGNYKSFAEGIYEKYTNTKLDVKNSRFLINFIGNPGTFKTYSFTDILNKKTDLSLFKNKLVLIGATSPDLHDDYFVPTSYGKAMPGVEIHANTLQTLLNKNFLSENNFLITIILIIIFSLLISFIVSRFTTLTSTILNVFLILIYIFITIKAFDFGFILNLVYIPLSCIFTQVSLISYFYISEKKEKAMITDAFGKYVSTHVIKEIMDNPEKLNLGGEKRTITVMFSDIRGFTTLSESLTPEELVHLLNEYLSEMTDIIMDKNGLVDKYIGDAIMAFWGAPLKEENHARLACEACLEMSSRLQELRKKWKEQGRPDMDIGIGLNTGDAVIGNMGSKKRFNYTAMGDTINLGSRLEGLTKHYGVRVIISEATNKEIKDSFLTRKLDFVAVKGKKQPVEIYELMCKKELADKKDIEFKETFEKALGEYSDQKWDNAVKNFKKCLELREDKASKVFIERSSLFKKNPPKSKEWNKVWVMETK